MRSLLHDYLATDGNPLYNTRTTSDANTNIFQRMQRDKSKVCLTDQTFNSSTND